jgi:hypothetical protein
MDISYTLIEDSAPISFIVPTGIGNHAPSQLSIFGA